jgi:hypothetical protein
MLIRTGAEATVIDQQGTPGIPYRDVLVGSSRLTHGVDEVDDPGQLLAIAERHGLTSPPSIVSLRSCKSQRFWATYCVDHSPEPRDMGKGGNAPVFQVILLRELGDVRQGQQTRSDPVVFRSIATFLNMSSVTVVAFQDRTMCREESKRARRKLVGSVD